MNRRLSFIVIPIVSLIVIYYLFLFSLHLFTYYSINQSNENAVTQNNLTVIVPKEASIGQVIDIELIYTPRLVRKDKINNISLVDNAGHYDIKTPIKFYDYKTYKTFYPNILSVVPYNMKFKYKIPSQLCTQQIVYTSCPESSTKKGVGRIRIAYDPLNDFWNYSGEGYQGDGEFITVPIKLK